MSAMHAMVEQEPPTPSMVAPLLPLALLEAIRAQDRPDEVLEDEDLTASLPRRFGLTGVVASQIQRYREDTRRGRQVPAADVVDLFRLVLRRPDAREILYEAGCLAARQLFERVPRPAVSALGILPRAAATAAARRAARKMLRKIHGPRRYEVMTRPWRALLFEPLTAELDSAGSACTFYGGLIEECFFLYTRERPQVTHSTCVTLGGAHCEWSLAL